MATMGLCIQFKMLVAMLRLAIWMDYVDSRLYFHMSVVYNVSGSTQILTETNINVCVVSMTDRLEMPS